MDSVHPVSPLDIVPLLLKQVSNQKIYTVMHLTGRLELSHIEASLLLMAEQHPLLRYRLTMHSGTPEWAPYESDFQPKCFNCRDTDADDRAVLKLVCESSADRKGLLHVFVLHGKTVDSLCLSVDHTLTDAAGTKAIAYELMANYGLIVAGSVPAPKRPLWRNSFGSLKNQFDLRKRIEAGINWRPAPGSWAMNSVMKPAIASNVNSIGQSDRAVPALAPKYMLRHIETAPVPQLKKKLSQYGATINDLLLASLFRSMVDLHNTSPHAKLPMQFTVDLRRHLPATQRFCVANLSGSVHVYLNGNAENHFGRTLAETHAKTTQLIQRNEALGGVLILDQLLKLSFHGTIKLLKRQFTASSRTQKANPLLTNFGLLDFDQLDLGTTNIKTAYMIGPNLLTPGLLISVSSYKNKLTISAGFDAALTDTRYIHAVLDLLSDRLNGL
jgi:NRPS condensation-like uncharacterized protein